jgi:hypothetical protein
VRGTKISGEASRLSAATISLLKSIVGMGYLRPRRLEMVGFLRSRCDGDHTPGKNKREPGLAPPALIAAGRCRGSGGFGSGVGRTRPPAGSMNPTAP